MDLLFSELDNREIVPLAPGPANCDPIRTFSHIALIGNYLPRRCGIATFTTDIFRAFNSVFPKVKMDVWAMNDGDCDYIYPTEVTGIIEQNDPFSYLSAAAEISASKADMVWLQHEFGIFGGDAGRYILMLIESQTVPVAVTLHTVLCEPDPEQRAVMNVLLDRCHLVMVMAEAAKQILIDTYQCNPQKIIVIPHGIPDRPFVATASMKGQFGWKERRVILTFGLLSPGKGIETMIAAMPKVAAQIPNSLYVILGATHPHCIAREGEAYRDKLKAMTKDLGIDDYVEWIDGFCETDELLAYLSAADIYVTPYLNPAQVTSGTLAYAVGLGKPVVSTPYVHATELLGGGDGRLVDFGDSAGFAKAIVDLLEDDAGLLDIRKRTYALGRDMIWPRFAEAAFSQFEKYAGIAKAQTTPIGPAFIRAGLTVQTVIGQSDPTGILHQPV